MSRALPLTLLLGLAACQGPPASELRTEPERLDSVRSLQRPWTTLEHSLAPLERAFDAHADVPRVVALLPERCPDCAAGLGAVRRSVLNSFPGEGLHVFVVVPADGVCDGCGAPACCAVDDPRVTVFADPEGLAASTFARGLLPIARAEDVFLFYPRGVRWHGAEAQPRPAAQEWWHSMGRIQPSRHCSLEELDATLRASTARVLDDEPRAAVVRSAHPLGQQ